MDISKLKYSLFRTTMSQIGIALILLLGLNMITAPLLGQNPSKEDLNNAVQSIARYTTPSVDRTSQLLASYGYQPPAYLKNEWRSFPAIRKIEMAYEAAEAVPAQRGKGGERLLALMSQDLARKYNGARAEAPLKNLIAKPLGDRKISFTHPSSYGQVNLPKHIKTQITTISKYTESGALGGNRGVLKYYMGLTDNLVYDILRNSKSSKDAIERGLKKAKVPPTQEQRIKNMGDALQNKYEAARHDADLNNITKKATQSSTKPSVKPQSVLGDLPKKPMNARPNNPHSRAVYNHFVKRNYATRAAKKMGAMKVNIKGFGGVIFGNEVIDKSNLPALKTIMFTPTEPHPTTGLEMGHLEFKFENGTEVLYPDLFVEDIQAAYEMIFGPNRDYEIGDGVGLVGVEGSGFNKTYNVIIHPSIQHLQLGWAALMTDILPISKSEIRAVPTIDESLVEAWFDKGYNNWKVTDIPLEIHVQHGQVQLKGIASNATTQSYLTMEGFYWGEHLGEITEFREVSPTLIEHISEYARLNDFAKVFALLRWAKMKGGSFTASPQVSNYYPNPIFAFIKNERAQALSHQGLQKYYKTQVTNTMNDFLKQEREGKLENTSDSLNVAFKTALKTYTAATQKTWLALENLDNSTCDIKLVHLLDEFDYIRCPIEMERVIRITKEEYEALYMLREYYCLQDE
ncbi:MAG: hypothetical protein ACPGJS_17485 [Flammeovirgaceae bacterium]